MAKNINLTRVKKVGEEIWQGEFIAITVILSFLI